MCRYHLISARSLDISHLLECIRMLSLHDVTLDDDVTGEKYHKKWYCQEQALLGHQFMQESHRFYPWSTVIPPIHE